MLKICLLVSGGLGFEVLTRIHHSEHQIKAVFTNRNSDSIIQFCKKNSFPTFVGNPRKNRAKEFIQAIDCQVLLSVNYLFIIEKDLINLPSLYAINFHGSLLPKYRGRTPHVWAIINDEKETGITAHIIDEKVDNGLIIHQETIIINENDTGGVLLTKFYKVYPKVVFKVLKYIENNTLSFTKQKAENAFYFGKRAPEDGQINWDWCKERVRNWIRAQAKPYPGAFTFYQNQKLTIHKAEFSGLGFHYKQANGTILDYKQEEIFVKTPNGTLKLSQIESITNIEIQKGMLLG